MQETNPTYEQDVDESEAPVPGRLRRRLISLAVVLLTILVLVFLPPYISVGRFQQRIAATIGASLGRPVHFNRVTLTLLPLPGVTLDNFVVDEDPAFGFEPILRAASVRATLRISSLWRHRIEFSTISLTEPTSVNLVRNADGRWNLESVLRQASHIEAAPTAQRFAGPAPRFPYIEATGARLNLKLGAEKTPFSLTDADFALWLPEPRQWHFRLEAHLARTDIAPADTGTFRVEGTLGNVDAHVASLAQLPININGDWQDAQLGGLSRLLLGRDAGLRGNLATNFSVVGSIGNATIATDFKLAQGRRADFVPPHLLSLEANCQAIAQQTFHSFTGIECHWPPAGASNPSILIAAGAVPDTRHPELSSADITLPALPAATFLDWLQVATPHPPTGLAGPGTLAGTLAWHAETSQPATPGELNPNHKIVISTAARSAQRRNPQLPGDTPTPNWSGELEFSGESLESPAFGPKPIPLGDILLRSSPPPAPLPPHTHNASTAPAQPASSPPASSSIAGFDLLPITLPLGGRQPATLEGHFDSTGYTLHLTGTAIPGRLLALGDAVPQFGDGLRKLLTPTSPAALDPLANPLEGAVISEVSSPVPPATSGATSADDPPTTPIHFDLTATRTWGGPQVWHETTPPPTHHR